METVEGIELSYSASTCQITCYLLSPLMFADFKATTGLSGEGSGSTD